MRDDGATTDDIDTFDPPEWSSLRDREWSSVDADPFWLDWDGGLVPLGAEPRREGLTAVPGATGEPRWRTPPWWRALCNVARQEGEAGESARRERASVVRHRDYARRIVAALGEVTWAECVQTDTYTEGGAERLALGDMEIRLDSTGVLPGTVRLDVGACARGVRDDWFRTPQEAAAQLARCSAVWRACALPDGSRSAAACRCGGMLCPLCMGSRGKRRRRLYQPYLEELAVRGCALLHLTRTQPTREDREAPIAFTIGDEVAMRKPTSGRVVGAGEVAGAVAGEHLGSALARLDAATVNVRDGRRVVTWQGGRIRLRDWWARTVVASLDARDITQRSPSGRLRWHVHAHQIVALAPGVDVAEWSAVWLSAWCESVGGSPSAQLVQRLPESGPALEGALRELLKYPAKISDMTTAGILEFLATCKGSRPHRAGAGLHSGTAAGEMAWLSAVLELLSEPEPSYAQELARRWLERRRLRPGEVQAREEAGEDVDAPLTVEEARERLVKAIRAQSDRAPWRVQLAALSKVGILAMIRSVPEPAIPLQRRPVPMLDGPDVLPSAARFVSVAELHLLKRAGVRSITVSSDEGETWRETDVAELLKEIQRWKPPPPRDGSPAARRDGSPPGARDG